MLRVISATDVRLAQLDRAFGYGPKGRGFESSNARVKTSKINYFRGFFAIATWKENRSESKKTETLI